MRETARTEPLFRKVDCLEIPVPDLESGLAFYRDRLGHELLWRTDTQAGLRLPDTDAEIVLQTERPEMAIDLLVTSAEEAAAAVEQAGGRVIVPPFPIRIGMCAVVQDPWENMLVLLDMRKGPLVTDETGRVIDGSGAGCGTDYPDGNRMNGRKARPDRWYDNKPGVRVWLVSKR